MPRTKVIKCDVAIVGAGIIGASLALDLAQAGISVILLEHNAKPKTKASTENEFSPRVSAISAASEKYFSSLGVWTEISRKQAYDKMHVWEKDGFGQIQFNANEIQHAHLGNIIENDIVIGALISKLEQHDKVDLRWQSTLTDFSHDDFLYHLYTEENQHIQCNLVIGADGANSRIKEMMGFAETFWDYEHTAIVANVKTQEAHKNVARQAFTPFGPLAFLPLSDPKQCSIVWSQKVEKARELLNLSEEKFCQALLVDLNAQLGQISLTTERHSFPLRMRYCRQWVSHNLALVGDAAHTIHPLAGQGANLGLADAAFLADIIKHDFINQVALGNLRSLRKYERARKAQAIKTIATMEMFKQVFDGDHPAKKLLRNLGLLGADKITAIKHFFMQQAAGEN